MPLKYKYKVKTEIPADQAALYTPRKIQEGGAEVEIYVLDVDGAVDGDRFNEFRTNNIKLNGTVTELTQKFDGIDPVKARELMAIASDLEAEKLVKKGEIDKVIGQRTEAMKVEHEKQLTKLTTEQKRLLSRLEELEINQAAVREATEFGLKPSAVLDITARARLIFTLHEGKPTAFGPDGKTPIFGKDGTEPLTIREWVESQVTQAPHLFEPNAGGGANGGGSGGASKHTGANPFKRETWNLTEQMKLLRSNPTLAAQLEKAAGVVK